MMKIVKLPTGTFKYDPAKPLGAAGGFGQVFLGESSKGETVAVKKLHLSAAAAAHRELQIADELKGRSFEHVVAFIDAGMDADTGDYFVIMPKAEGSLQNTVTKAGPLEPCAAADVLLQIAKGLIEVGDLVHRDLKPDNILLHEGRWKIADFGIARFVEEVTASNTLKDYLSPYYAAPEQWRLERATHATDVYALGCIAFCLLAGTPPFTNNPQSEHQSAPVPAFACLEPRLVNLINMCLRKVASGRPSLSRVRDLLAEIVAKPQRPGALGSLSSLAKAAAHVSTKEQEAQARAAAARAAWEARCALARCGYEILIESAERLWGKIHAHAANAVRTKERGLFEFIIGEGHLIIDPTGSAVVDPGSFPHSGWDVVAFAQITVRQQKPSYQWSASLWYAKIKGGVDYRWHEASYWTMRGRECEPYSEPPGQVADMAASNIMCGVNCVLTISFPH